MWRGCYPAGQGCSFGEQRPAGPESQELQFPAPHSHLPPSPDLSPLPSGKLLSSSMVASRSSTPYCLVGVPPSPSHAEGIRGAKAKQPLCPVQGSLPSGGLTMQDPSSLLPGRLLTLFPSPGALSEGQAGQRLVLLSTVTSWTPVSQVPASGENAGSPEEWPLLGHSHRQAWQPGIRPSAGPALPQPSEP